MHYDKNGNYISWWTNASKDAFELKSRCLSDQYSNYTIFGKNVSSIFYNQHSSSVLTIH